MVVLAPGTILQHLYFAERLKSMAPGRFLEVGPGRGDLTQFLLRRGWQGTVVERNTETAGDLRVALESHVRSGRLEVLDGDFLALSLPPAAADMVVSCMVLEHLDETLERSFMRNALRCVAANGLMAGFVPGSPRHWGVEDVIAGHCRRYTRDSLRRSLQDSGWRVTHLAGLTYPLSNALLPLSNRLVGRAEAAHAGLSMTERTLLSGRRRVSFKTRFPSWVGMAVNAWTLHPLHWLQKQCSDAEDALVLYFEAVPQDAARGP